MKTNCSIKPKLKTKWKNVKVNPRLNEDGFHDIFELKVLENYDLSYLSCASDKPIKKKSKRKKKVKGVKSAKQDDQCSDGVQNCLPVENLQSENIIEKSPVKDEEENTSFIEEKSHDMLDGVPKSDGNLKTNKRKIESSTKLSKRKKLKQESSSVDSRESNVSENKVDIKKSSPKLTKKTKLKQESSSVYSCESSVSENKVDVKEVEIGWKNLHAPVEVFQALADKGFVYPLPIQSLVLPHAIRDKMDIIGAAETGSGKTLAFGIPILSHIIDLKKRLSATVDALPSDDDMKNSVNDINENDNEESTYGESIECNDVTLDEIDDIHENDENTSDEIDLPPCDTEESFDLQENEKGCVYAVNDVDMEWLNEDSSDKITSDSPLYSVILAPTRELAVQVKSHLANVAKYTDIKVAVVVGGISMQKQQRLLKQCPEIVVATPGRLWELIQQGEPHLSKVEDIKFLVIDEADRMVEKGHFAELISFLEHINSDEENKKKRQNFVFSATLTLTHGAPERIFKKKKKKTILSSEDNLKNLISVVGMKEKAKVIDLSKKIGISQALTETRIGCNMDEKDLFLYYVLLQHPGRTLVFTNTKDCVRRLVNILETLQCSPYPLHSDMHQKQRLKNLDRFKADAQGLLIATDVAARGLDIPGVEHVIHYQVPKTSENYVHRSGRTARASNEGLSILMICPQEIRLYRKLIHTLNKDEDLQAFPLDMDCLANLKERVELAKDIDKKSHKVKKQKKQNGWFENLAKEADLVLDESLLHDLGDDFEKSQLRQELDYKKEMLKSLLQADIMQKQYTGKYPTKSGSLELPTHFNINTSKAVDIAKSARQIKSKKNANTDINIKVTKSTGRKRKKKFRKPVKGIEDAKSVGQNKKKKM